MELIWSGPWDMSGYGAASREYAKVLEGKVDMKVHNLSPSRALSNKGLNEDEEQRLHRLNAATVSTNAIHVQHSVPGAWQVGAFRRTAGYTVYESDGLPGQRVWFCNLVDEIWTASEFNKETFTKAGVQTPIYVIPHIVDVTRFHPDVTPLEIPNPENRYVFLSVFDFHWRKGWDVLLNAWWQEFSKEDGVMLLIKTYSGDDSAEAQGRIHKMLQKFKEQAGFSKKSTAPVALIGNFLSHQQMEQLYASADCFVLPSRGEGWGLGYSEAMAMELPTIGTNWSGNLQFMNPENSYLINIEGLTSVSDPYLLQIEPGYWGHKMAAPSIDHLRHLMREVFNNQEAAKAKGRFARQQLQERFAPEVIVKLLLERLEALDAKEGPIKTGFFTSRP